MLATFSTVGVVRIWDLETYKNIKTLMDSDEKYINEFYVGKFLPNTSYLAAAGKLKDPKKWSHEDSDNHILPTPIKIFDVITGEIVNQLHGHDEEILCLKVVEYKNENYLVSTSQDGYIVKWSMSKGWTNLLKSCRIEDGETCMAFNVAFLPNTGNRLFVAACDNHVALFDFETEKKIQKFGEIYSCYCDYVMVVPCLDLEPPRFPNLSRFLQNVTINIDSELSQERLESCFTYLITRGVEEVEEIYGVPISACFDEYFPLHNTYTLLNSNYSLLLVITPDSCADTQPNSVRLHKLNYLTSSDDEFSLEEIAKFTHPE